MKKLTSLVVIVLFCSCNKKEAFVPPINQLQQKLISKALYHAVTFIVDGKNTILPDTNNILGGPITYMDVNFTKGDSIEMNCEVIKNGLKDKSGSMYMKWTIDKYEERILISDKNLWTSKIFEGNHLIKTNTKNQVVISGTLNNANYPFELTLE